MPNSIMNLSIKVDSSDFSKAMENINRDMLDVAKNAASMSAKIQQIISEFSDIINNRRKENEECHGDVSLDSVTGTYHLTVSRGRIT